MRYQALNCVILCALAATGCVAPDAANRPPVANAGKDLRAVKFETTVYLQLDGTQSHDPDSNHVEWRWDVVRSPGTLFLDGAQRVSESPVIGLNETGLHIFRLTVRDLEATESYDFVNVYVVDGLVLDEPQVPDGAVSDVGVADADVADAGADDAGVDDAGVDGAVPDAAVVPDSGPSPNRPPQPVISALADRIDLGQAFHLGIEGTRDEDPLALEATWRLVQRPNGVDFDFEGEGLTADFVPPAGGRYTVRLTVSDGEFEAAVERSFYVRVPQVWAVSTSQGRAEPRSAIDGTVSAAPVAFGALGAEPTGFAARAGVLYLALRRAGAGSPSLAIAVPGAGVTRRSLPGEGRPGRVFPTQGGVWVTMWSEPTLFFSDAAGRAALLPLELPVAYTSSRGLAVDVGDGWLVNAEQPSAVVALDLAGREVSGVLYREDGTCQLQDIAMTQGQLIAACRGQNGLRRVAETPGPLIRLGPSGDKALKLAASGGWVAVLHRGKRFATVVEAAGFDVEGAPEPLTLPVDGTVLDVAVSAGVAYVLSDAGGGATFITAFDLPSGEQRWSQPTGVRTATMLAVDAADDFDLDLGSL